VHRYLDLLTAYLGPQRGRVAALFVLLATSIGLQMLAPQLLRELIDSAQNDSAENNLSALALVFLLVVLVKQALAPLTSWVSDTVAWTATNALREDLMLRCLQLDLSFHNLHTPGQLIERIDGDTSALSSFFSQFVIRMLGSALILLGTLIILLLQELWMGLAITIFTLIAMLVLRRIQGMAVPYYKVYRQQIAEVTGFLEERIMGTEDIRGNGAVAFTVQRLLELYTTLARKSLAATVIARVTQSGLELMIAVGIALVLGLGAYLFQIRFISLGAIYLAVAYTDLIARNLNEVTAQLDSFQMARAALDRIDELRNQKSLLKDGHRDLPTGQPLSVEFNRVTFAYTKSRSTLDNLSFTILPGQTLGLLGRTGSGKTTIARLVARFLEVNHGEIKLHGINISDISLASVRQRVGLVTQEVQLFQGSVRDNLTFWDETISDRVILDALDQLGLTPWLKRLPDGLDTPLMHGNGLSAGEAQLVALARVFLQDPGLIILDEASARLDPRTEQLIETALDRLLQNRTAIIIAHRLSTIMRADDILLLEDGRVIEQGARAILERNPSSRFATLLRSAMLNPSAASTYGGVQ